MDRDTHHPGILGGGSHFNILPKGYPSDFPSDRGHGPAAAAWSCRIPIWSSHRRPRRRTPGLYWAHRVPPQLPTSSDEITTRSPRDQNEITTSSDEITTRSSRDHHEVTARSGDHNEITKGSPRDHHEITTGSSRDHHGITMRRRRTARESPACPSGPSGPFSACRRWGSRETCRGRPCAGRPVNRVGCGDGRE